MRPGSARQRGGGALGRSLPRRSGGSGPAAPRQSGGRRPRRASHLHSPAVIFICGGNEVVSGAPSVAEPDIQIACRVACHPQPPPRPSLESRGCAARACIFLFPDALSQLSLSSLPFVFLMRLGSLRSAAVPRSSDPATPGMHIQPPSH